MEILHLTPEKNLNSIFKYGILRNKPILSKYNDVMESMYGSKYDKDKGLVFCFPEGIVKRDKYIIDFSYWKSWGDVRNRILDPLSNKEFYKWDEIGFKVFSGIKPKLDKLKVLLLEVEYEENFTYYKHHQSHTMGNLWRDMDFRYEHNDKPLVLLNYDVKPNKIKKVIGSVESFYNRGKINITLDI